MPSAIQRYVQSTFLLATLTACGAKISPSAPAGAAISPLAASAFETIQNSMKSNPKFQSELVAKQDLNFTSLLGNTKLSTQASAGLSGLDTTYGTAGQFFQTMGVNTASLTLSEVQKAATLPATIDSSASQADLLADMKDTATQFKVALFMLQAKNSTSLGLLTPRYVADSEINPDTDIQVGAPNIVSPYASACRGLDGQGDSTVGAVQAYMRPNASGYDTLLNCVKVQITPENSNFILGTAALQSRGTITSALGSLGLRDGGSGSDNGF